MDQFLSATEVQTSLAHWCHAKRKSQKLSRNALAQRSTVPAPTIRHFENSGQISLRQFLLLWQSLDQLDRVVNLTRPAETLPLSIDEVLQN